MEVVHSKKKQGISLVSFIIAAVLTLGLILSKDISYSLFLSSYAMELMLLLLLFGFLGFIYRKNAIIFINFFACILLCSFLKDSEFKNIASTTSTTEVDIKVTHVVLDNKESILNFSKKINYIETDFLSIQTLIEPTLEEELTKNLSQIMPYWQKTICNNNTTLFVFSTYELRNLDTLYCHYNKTVSLVGAMFIDANHKEISFLSTQVPIDRHKISSAKKHLASLSNYIEKNCQDKPLLTLNGTQINSWKSEIDAFRRVHKLSDSRTDGDFLPKDEHIFYSKGLICTNFVEILDGDGVEATYQFKKNNSTISSDKPKTPSMLGFTL